MVVQQYTDVFFLAEEVVEALNMAWLAVKGVAVPYHH
jgi:hypothetical protein